MELPFATPDSGTQWMWVEVLRWTGDTIEGVLSYEPFNVPDLHAGQRVTGSMDDVFDYNLPARGRAGRGKRDVADY